MTANDFRTLLPRRGSVQLRGTDTRSPRPAESHNSTLDAEQVARVDRLFDPSTFHFGENALAPADQTAEQEESDETTAFHETTISSPTSQLERVEQTRSFDAPPAAPGGVTLLQGIECALGAAIVVLLLQLSLQLKRLPNTPLQPLAAMAAEPSRAIGTTAGVLRRRMWQPTKKSESGHTPSQDSQSPSSEHGGQQSLQLQSAIFEDILKENLEFASRTPV